MKTLPYLKPLTLCLAALLPCLLPVAGCKRTSSSSPAPSTAQRFTVEETFPVGGAPDISGDSLVEVVFSSDINLSTVDTSSFIVEGSRSGKRAGTYTSQNARRIAFKAASPFGSEETVDVRLTDAIRSLTDQALVPIHFSFKIEKTEDEEEPPPEPPAPPPETIMTIVSSIPAPYQLAVAREQVIAILFSDMLDASTVTSDSVSVLSNQRGLVPADPEIFPGGNTGSLLTLTPTEPFMAGESVTVNLSSTLMDVTGLSFPGATLRFSVQSTAPEGNRELEQVFSTLGNVRTIAIGDLNSDRLADVVYTSENETVADVLLGQGDGTLLPALRIDVAQSILTLALADVDLDSDLDVIIGTADRARIYHNLSQDEGPSPDSIAFEVGPQAPTGTAVRGIATGDLDHVGLPDVVLDTDRGIRVYLGGLGHPAAQVLGDERMARTAPVLADLDIDGHNDLIFGSRRGGRISYYFSSGSPVAPFADPQHVELGTDAEQIAVENLTGTENPEILVLSLGAASLGGAAFQILYETGSGFAVQGGLGVITNSGAGEGDEVVLDTGSFALADINGNGFPDIILAAAVPGNVTWFPNHDGSYDFGVDGIELLTAPEVSLVGAADLTGNGTLDIVAGGKGELHTLLPTAAQPPPPPGEDTFSVAVLDSQARQGDTGLAALLRITNTQPLEGYSVTIGYEPAAVLPKEINLEGTITNPDLVEFTDFQIHEDDPAISYVVIVDFFPPLEGNVLPASENQLLFRLIYDVLADAPLGEATFDFPTEVGTPPILTKLVVAGGTVTPELLPGKLTIFEPNDPPSSSVNLIELTSTDVAPGEEGQVIALARSEEDLSAYTILFTFDPAAIEVLALDLVGSDAEGVGAELVIPQINTGNAVITVLLDFVPPFARQVIPAGEDVHLCTIRFRAIENTAPGVYPLTLENNIGDPPLNNIFVFDGQSIFPDLLSGEVHIGNDLEPTFVRGDFNGSSVVDLSDPIALVAHLFQGGEAPPCADAADFDDNGRVELTDAIFGIDHLFKGGPAPPDPFPEAGVDPTPDDLDCDDAS